MFRSILLLALTLFLAGCGQQNSETVSVAGSVTIAGQPLSGAVITFEPLPGTPGPKASSVVLDGQYRIEPSAGLRPGQFRVRISMLPSEMLSSVAPDSAQLVIAAEFDSNSQLSADLKTTEPNQADFQVEALARTGR
jgi:hypothetical protein